eukprot:c19162_g1_i6 orf=349-774(-)
MKEMVEGKAAIQSDLHFTYSSSSMDSVRPLEALPNGIKKGVATRHSDCSWLLQQRIKGFVKVLVVGLLQGRLPVIPISKYQIRDFSCQGNENDFLRLLKDELNLPIFGLVDGDPYGLDILLTYRFGSMGTDSFNAEQRNKI